MKQTLLRSLCALLLLAPCPSHAATQVSTGQQALAQAGDDGILIITYAQDWDKFSKQRSQDIIQNERVLKAAGSACYLNYPTYANIPDKTLQAQLDQVRGELNFTPPQSYPAILLLDKKGQHLASLDGPIINSGSMDDIAQLLATRIADIKLYHYYLQQAQKATGPEQAKLLGIAAEIPHIIRSKAQNKELERAIQKADPEDHSKAYQHWKTTDYSMAALVREKSYPEALRFIDEVLCDQHYSNLAKQGALAAIIGRWRTEGSNAELSRIRQYAHLMRALNPDNLHAKSSGYVLQHWLIEKSDTASDKGKKGKKGKKAGRGKK